MEINKLKFEKLNVTELKNLTGGGEPVPGAEILIEQVPDDVPVQGSGSTGTANKTGGKYMGQVGHF